MGRRHRAEHGPCPYRTRPPYRCDAISLDMSTLVLGSCTTRDWCPASVEMTSKS